MAIQQLSESMSSKSIIKNTNLVCFFIFIIFFLCIINLFYNISGYLISYLLILFLRIP